MVLLAKNLERGLICEVGEWEEGIIYATRLFHVANSYHRKTPVGIRMKYVLEKKSRTNRISWMCTVREAVSKELTT